MAREQYNKNNSKLLTFLFENQNCDKCFFFRYVKCPLIK